MWWARRRSAPWWCWWSAGVVVVADKDDDIVYIEGVVEGVEVCVDLEDAAGYLRAEHDFPFIFMDYGDVAGPYLKVMQGCHTN